MRQRHPLRTLLLLTTASVAGTVGQLILPVEWSTVALAVMLVPPGHALLARRR